MISLQGETRPAAPSAISYDHYARIVSTLVRLRRKSDLNHADKLQERICQALEQEALTPARALELMERIQRWKVRLDQQCVGSGTEAVPVDRRRRRTTKA